MASSVGESAVDTSADISVADSCTGETDTSVGGNLTGTDAVIAGLLQVNDELRTNLKVLVAKLDTQMQTLEKKQRRRIKKGKMPAEASEAVPTAALKKHRHATPPPRPDSRR